MRRLAPLFAALLACGLIAAGCGDDDDSGDDSAVTTQTAPADTTSEDTDTTSEDTDTTSGDIDSLDEAVQACKDNVQSTASQLSEDLRNDLEGLCDKAASGDEDDLRQASQEICKKVVEETVPEGSPREQALAACDDVSP